MVMPLLVILFGVLHAQSLVGLCIILFGYGIIVGFSAPFSRRLLAMSTASIEEQL